MYTDPLSRRRFLHRSAGSLAGGLACLALPSGGAEPATAASRPDKDSPPTAGMLKFLFLDNRPFDVVEGFQRRVEQVHKHPGNPLLVADRPWEFGNITLYGSVLKPPGRPFQLWYSVIEPPWHMMLAYAESDDGLNWRKPELDVYRHEGRQTNIVFTDDPHGPTVIYDAADQRQDWKYKMLCGASPGGKIHAYHSADGIHWQAVQAGPVINTRPDCPMSLVRRADGTYAAHHRVQPGSGRRVCRSESSDFVHWQGGQIVLEPGPGDPAQFEMYGMGATPYGDLEFGTLWAYHTDLALNLRGRMQGSYFAELTYSRSGWCWHRAAQGEPFVPHGGADDWDSGNVQCASAPVFLEDEIRYYYAASNVRHASHWELKPGRFGAGLATVRPDRFLALVAGHEPGELCTRSFSLPSAEIYVNAAIEREGDVRAELLGGDGQPVAGAELQRCARLSGDATDHRLRWEGAPDLKALVGRSVRLRVRATHAAIYSIWVPYPATASRYWDFRSL